MSIPYYLRKTANENTKFRACTIAVNGIVKYGLIDQDGDLVGLSSQTTPYYIDSCHNIHAIANSGIKPNTLYNGFSTTEKTHNIYHLSQAADESPTQHRYSKTSSRRTQGIANHAAELLAKITGEKQKHNHRLIINGTYFDVQETFPALVK